MEDFFPLEESFYVPPELEIFTSDQLNLKIKNALYQIVTPEFKMSDDSILQQLYDRLSPLVIKKSKSHVKAFMSKWFFMVANDWNKINPSSLAFALKMLSLVCSVEINFKILSTSKIQDRIHESINIVNENKLPLTSAYFEFIHSVVSHRAGCSWVWLKGIWKDVLLISRTSTSLYVLRKTHQILADFLIFSGENNMNIFHTIFGEIFQACSDITMEEKSLLSSIMEKNIPYHHEYFHGSSNHLNSIVIIRETVLKMLIRQLKTEKIDLMLRKYKLQEWILHTLNNTNDVRVITELSRLLCVLNMCFLSHSDNGKVKYSNMRLLSQQFLDQCNILIKKQQFILIQEVCLEYFKLWNQFGGEIVHDIKETDSDNIYVFENTLFIILTVPLFMFIRIGSATKSDLMEAYADKVFEVACLQTKRTAYSYKSEILQRKDINLESIASSSVQCFIRISNICKKEQGVMIFQILVHIVKKILSTNDIVHFPDKNNIYSLPESQGILECCHLLSSTIEALNCYISNFNLTWSDSLETLCVMPLLQKLMMFPDISPRMSADILKLQKTVLLGYLPANLALLMDTLEGSSMGFIGKQIYKNLHSVHWEVRDSALELLQVICTLSEQKLPVFQKVILEANLPLLVLSCFENDRESYVRSSALNCLSSMVKIKSLWVGYLADQSLLEKLFHSLLNEPEGNVRCGSLMLLKEIYNYKDLRPEEIEKIMDVLYHITLSDLHWEVKNGAILFWDSVLEKKLSEEGMVDGHFPDHLFSREKRKIIKLTPTENSERIRKVFESLSDFGCLYALWHIIQDDCDLLVTGEAGKLITKMIDLVNKFEVPINKNEIRDEAEGEGERNGLKRKISSEEMESENEYFINTSDEVIESIVSEGDINLVCGLFSDMNSPVITTSQLKTRKKLSFDNFRNHVSKIDLLRNQFDKVVWLHQMSEGIDSIVDDVLISTQHQEKNIGIDCY